MPLTCMIWVSHLLHVGYGAAVMAFLHSDTKSVTNYSLNLMCFDVPYMHELTGIPAAKWDTMTLVYNGGTIVTQQL